MNFLTSSNSRSRLRQLSIATFVVAAFTASTRTCEAQDTDIDPASGLSTELAIFYLKHMDADGAAQMIDALTGESDSLRLIADGNNRLIVAGSKEELKVIERLLAQLDVKPTEDRFVEAFPLKDADALDLAQVLQNLVPQGVKIAADPRTNTLIVQGSAKELEAVQMMFEQLENAKKVRSDEETPRSYKVELFWLMEVGDGDEALSLREPDARLSEAVEELVGQGFEKMGQAGYTRVAVKAGGTFQVSSGASLGQLDAQGELGPGENERLELLLEIEISNENASVVSLATEITTKPDHNVVIGVAGATPDQPDRRSAFVIRVSE